MAEVLVFTAPGNLNVGEYVPYRRGDVVVVKEDGAPGTVWGKREDKRAWVAAGNSPESFPSDTVIIKFDDLNLAAALALMEAGTRAAVPGDPEFDDLPAPRTVRGELEVIVPDPVRTFKRVWNIDLDGLNNNQLNELNDIGYLELVPARFRQLTRNKATGENYDDRGP